MPEFEISTSDKAKAYELLKFVKEFYNDLSREGRMVFAIEVSKHLKPIVEEMKSVAAKENTMKG